MFLKKKAIPYYKNLRPISVTVKEVLDNRKVKVYMEWIGLDWIY